MLQVTINGQQVGVAAGGTILDALRASDVQVPTLCHDDRLKPIGGCRLCIVNVAGCKRPLTACSTPLADGMQIETHSPDLEATRQTLLRLLAGNYPSEALAQSPNKDFHRWLKHYGINPARSTDRVAASQPRHSIPPTIPPFTDSSHPYINIDMERCITCFRCVRICEEVQGQFTWRVWNRGDATRILPDSGTTLLASSCVSCGACADTCPTGALEDKTVLHSGEPSTWTRTTCPYCGTGCEMLLGVRDGRIVQVRPAMDAAVNKGHLCVKGRYAFGFNHATDRMTRPMIRRGGEWREVSWDEALAFVAENFQRILRDSGPQSLGVLGSARATNEENYLAQKFARVVLHTNNVDCCARVCHAPTAAAMKKMVGTGAATNSFDDIEKARAILICGCNPTECHPIVGARIKRAALNGATLIVIDPRETELVRYAACHIALRPGTNVPLLNAMAKVILDEGLADKTFIHERISSLPEFERFVARVSIDATAEICGVSADAIRRAARLYAGRGPSMCFHGLGVTEHTQGTEGVMCLVNLALLTGNLGKPGAGINPLRGQNNVQGAAHMGCEPENLTGFVPIADGRALFESIWKTGLPNVAGLNLMEMMDAAAARQLKALWAIGYDIALTNPNTSATRGALRSLEFLVVQDMFMNETAREFAHVFLPAASPFEKDGTFMNADRRVQRVRKAVDPPGQARPDWRIICELASVMGFHKQFAFQSPEEIWNEVRTVWKAGAGISYARIEGHGLQWPCPGEGHPGTAILHTESFPSGQRAPLACIDFEPTAECTSSEYPFLLTTGRSLYQFNAATMTARTLNTALRDTDFLDISPLDAVRLGLHDSDKVRIRSRYGEAITCINVDPALRSGELFTTFHAAKVRLNNVTSPFRDRLVKTPEYKVVAVNIEKV